MITSRTRPNVAKRRTLTQPFQTGMEMGEQRLWRHTTLPTDLYFSRGEEGLVEVIRNLVSYNYHDLPEEILRQDIGIVVGYVLSHPDEFTS